MKYRIPLEKGDTFFGIAYSINNILDKTSSYFYELKEYEEELRASNEEISATYQQLAASDEELRAQYEEIQEYTQKLENLKDEEAKKRVSNFEKNIKKPNKLKRIFSFIYEIPLPIYKNEKIYQHDIR